MTGYKNPPRRKTDVAHITVCDAIQKRLIARYRLLGTWKAVGDEIGVAAGTVNRVATTDYRPTNAALRAKLGLPVLRPAPACECGEVHLSKHCPNKPRPPAKPRTKWKQVAGERAELLEETLNILADVWNQFSITGTVNGIQRQTDGGLSVLEDVQDLRDKIGETIRAACPNQSAG